MTDDKKETNNEERVEQPDIPKSDDKVLDAIWDKIAKKRKKAKDDQRKQS